MTKVIQPARPASQRWNVAKTLMQTGLFWLTFLGLLPALVYSLETSLGLDSWRFASLPWRIVGLVLFTLGGMLGLTSGMTMAIKGKGTPLPLDCPREIVLAGPYRYVRNPMAVAGLVQGVAVGLFVGSPAVVAYALSGGPIWNYLVRPMEERDLQQRFGKPYRAYQATVHCWWPRRHPYQVASDVTSKSNLHTACAEREKS